MYWVVIGWWLYEYYVLFGEFLVGCVDVIDFE